MSSNEQPTISSDRGDSSPPTNKNSTDATVHQTPSPTNFVSDEVTIADEAMASPSISSPALNTGATATSTPSSGSSSASSPAAAAKAAAAAAASVSGSSSTNNSSDAQPMQILTKPRLQELVREIDPTEQLDEEVEELLLQIADDFVENTVNAACLLAKHRKVSKVEVKDVQLHLGEWRGGEQQSAWTCKANNNALIP